MRPTFLGFRSPKERTPDPTFPKVTYDGRKLNYIGYKKSNSFCKERRFRGYDIRARNTNSKIGPGSYTPLNGIGNGRIPGGYVYKDLIGKKYIDNGEYFYVENNLVFDSKLSRRLKNSVIDDYEEGTLSKRESFGSRHRSSRSVRNNGSKKTIFGKLSGRNFHTGSDLRIENKKKKEVKSIKLISRILSERFK